MKNTSLEKVFPLETHSLQEHYGKETDKHAMKTFDEFIQEESHDLNESRLLRKGGALLLARSAKKHGDDATRSLSDAKRKIKGSSLDSDEERLKGIQVGLQDLCDGLISMRKQNGAITGIVTAAVLLNERTNRQMKLLVRSK